MKKYLVRLVLATCVAVATLGSASHLAQAKTIKIGFISVFSGPAAFAGDYAEKGMQLFLSQNPDAFGKHKVEIIKRDATGPNAEVSRRLAQELIIKEKVDLLVGLTFSPNAFAIAGLVNKAKIPVIIQNAATSSITNKSPYFVRVSRTLWSSSYPLGKYLVEKKGTKTAAILYSDYAPGKDAKNAFTKSFTEAGGKILDTIPLPFPQTPDFTPFLQRIKKAKPDVVFVFVPGGKYSTSFVKTYHSIGLTKVSRLVGSLDLTPPTELDLMGEGIDNALVVGHYTPNLDNAENKKFVAAWNAKYPGKIVDSFALQAYDSMAVIAEGVRKTDGKFNGDSFVAAVKGWSYKSPRGPFKIHEKSRDVVQNQYVMEVRRGKDGKLATHVTDTLPNIGDPWKDLGLGKK